MELSKIELERYSRQISLSEVGPEGQLKLKAASILIVGLGGLGCPALQYLAAAGVGRIGILDFDYVSLSNLHRQTLYITTDIDKRKVDVCLRRTQAQNPDVSIEAHFCKLQSHNALQIVRNYDLVLDGSDNFATRYLINDACVLAGKPFVAASILKFSGQISAYNYKQGPTYRCLFPEPPADELAPSCAEAGVLGVLPGIMGCLQANECLKIILGLGQILSGKLMIFNALNLKTEILDFSHIKRKYPYKSILPQSEYEKLGPCLQNQEHREISPQQLKQLLKEIPSEICLVDVRTEAERNSEHIGGIFIPLKELALKTDLIDTSKKIIFYCESGIRSIKACEIFKDLQPQAEVFSLKGGPKDFR